MAEGEAKPGALKGSPPGAKPGQTRRGSRARKPGAKPGGKPRPSKGGRGRGLRNRGAGLGGPRYARTRHNAGFRVVTALAGKDAVWKDFRGLGLVRSSRGMLPLSSP